MVISPAAISLSSPFPESLFNKLQNKPFDGAILGGVEQRQKRS